MTYQEVEEARKIYLKRIKTQILVTVIIIVVASIALFVNTGSATQGFLYCLLIAFMVAMFSFILCILLNSKISTAYSKAYKAFFVEQNLRKVFSDLHYDHSTGIPPSVLSSTGMINTGDRYTANDLVKGKYKKVNFAQSDVHIETRHTDKDGNTQYVTIFRGRFMIFDFPKQFTFRLALVGKRFPAFRKPGRNKTNGRKMETLSTESGEFNKLLKTYAEDGFEAFYILDPALIADIEDLTTHYKRRILFCFFDNYLIIGIHDGKDSFEPPTAFKSIDESKENAKVGNDIKMITKFVDELSLDRKLFK